MNYYNYNSGIEKLIPEDISNFKDAPRAIARRGAVPTTRTQYIPECKNEKCILYFNGVKIMI